MRKYRPYAQPMTYTKHSVTGAVSYPECRCQQSQALEASSTHCLTDKISQHQSFKPSHQVLQHTYRITNYVHSCSPKSQENNSVRGSGSKMTSYMQINRTGKQPYQPDFSCPLKSLYQSESRGSLPLSGTNDRSHLRIGTEPWAQGPMFNTSTSSWLQVGARPNHVNFSCVPPFLICKRTMKPSWKDSCEDIG